MKKRKWWLIPVAVLLVLILLAAVFWQTLIIYIAPKLVLADALKESIAGIETRIAASPVPILVRGIDPEGKNHLRLQLDTNNDLSGAVHYDMDVMTQSRPKRILASGKAVLPNAEIDLSLYLDKYFAAISSDGILGGQFYGLTYDTFSQDIRSNKLIAMLIGETVLQSWESKVSLLKDGMGQELPAMPDLSGVDLQPLAMGVLSLDADVERVRIDLNGVKESYHVISFESSVSEIKAGLEYLNMDIPIVLNTDEEVEFAFWLKDRKLVKAEISGDTQKLDVYWGSAPVSFLSEDDLYIEYFDGKLFRTCRISTQQTENQYKETITYVGEEKAALSYDWSAGTGELLLSLQANGEQTELSLKLTPTENGFTVMANDFGALMHLFLGTPDSADHPCTLAVSKGADFETPEYKNFVDWSAEDLMTVLSGFGSLLGLKLP